MDYEYDFFLSYPSQALLAGPWVVHHFYPALKAALEAEDAFSTVFCWTENEVGSIWPEVLKDAHARSRLLIAVLTPPYFYKSPWCRAEWATMIERQKLTGLGAPLGKQSLICPVLFSDGETYPDEAQKITPSDFRKWAFPDLVFKKTRDFNYFRTDVHDFAKAILERRSLAPPWSDTWPVLQPEVLSPPRATLPRL